MKYGPIDVVVEPIGKRRLVGEFWRQDFQVRLTSPKFQHTMTVKVDYDDQEEPIVGKMAAWRAIDELFAAAKDPDRYGREAVRARERSRDEADRTINAALAFGEQALYDAFGEAVSETDRLMKTIERRGSREWFPGA